jgi:hypothetical protein
MSRTRSRSRRSVACSRAERDDLGVLLGEEVLDVGHRALLPACLHSCVTAVTVVVARMADDARGVEAARARERRAQHRLQLRRANRLSNIQLGNAPDSQPESFGIFNYSVFIGPTTSDGVRVGATDVDKLGRYPQSEGGFSEA